MTIGNKASHIQTLPDGYLDIIGDIHGEIDALNDLLKQLGYDKDGNHPNNRTIVFIGDFVDRGPSSPAVIRLAKKLMDKGHAVAVLGNHELNVLVNDAKSGSSWWFDERIAKDLEEGYGETEHISNSVERQQTLEWLASLPLALERKDLRVVHAAWHAPSLHAVRNSTENVSDIYRRYEAASKEDFQQSGLAEQLEKEMQRWESELDNPNAAMPMLPALAEEDVRYQMNNPIRVLTSGTEEKANVPFFASNKWRFCNRGKWWDSYEDKTPVIIGHYSRRFHSSGTVDFGLFQGQGVCDWTGKLHNVFCVDYGVGYRHKERSKGCSDSNKSEFKLAALRWPERTLMFDNGQEMNTQKYLANSENS